MADLPLTGAPASARADDPRRSLVIAFAVLCVVAFYASAAICFYGSDLFGPIRAVGNIFTGLFSGRWGTAFNPMAWITVLFTLGIVMRTVSWFGFEGQQSYAGNFFNDSGLRNFFFEMLLLGVLGWLFWFIVGNAVNNLAAAGIASGFDFLRRPAGLGSRRGDLL